MGMGMLFGALSGAGNALADSVTASRKVDDERSLMQERAALEEMKALRIDEITRGRNREDAAYKLEQAEAPAKRFSGLLGSKLAEDVPVEPAAVTKSTSEGAKAAGLKDGLVGMTREQVMAYNDPDMLAQYDKQMGEDNRMASEKVAGQTRKRSQSEAIKATLDESLVKDPSAFVAGRSLTAPDKADLEDRKMASKEKLEEMRIAQRDRSDDKRFDAMMERIEAKGSGEDGAKGLKLETARAIQKDLAEVTSEMKAIQTQKAKNSLFGEDLVEANNILTKLAAKREKIRKARNKYMTQAGIDIPDYDDEAEEVKPPPPANRPPLSSFKK